ncbi:MAG: topoisomerase DNA-binding C4 zinc finger domain-containing protein [Candidatus Diapherotrites archaeon]|nr:topoisomerase DNA-binding C4 zinc finger domain-containing protein [Candidatus Diapherotrites archaeon]
MTRCAGCGKTATTTNKAGVPTCARCQSSTIQMPLCPECGSTMALRTGKFGSFWGCNMYPNCVGTKRLGQK